MSQDTATHKAMLDDLFAEVAEGDAMQVSYTLPFGDLPTVDVRMEVAALYREEGWSGTWTIGTRDNGDGTHTTSIRLLA